MDLLSLHIEYLLTRHDCVIVPGFGAFIASDKEARIDIERGLIIPGRREITFNGSVVTDDGLLAHSIARREHLAYEEAHRRMTMLVTAFKKNLENEGEVSVGMTGRLIRNEEGLTTFLPRIAKSISDIMPELKLHVAARAETSTALKETNEVTSEAHPIQEENGEKMRTIIVAPDRYVFTISKRAVHAAAMLITIFTVALSMLVPINYDQQQKASVMSVDEIFRRTVHPALKVEQNQEKKVNAETDSIPASLESVGN